MINYSKYHYKITTISQGKDYSWLFLPGGPGLGSEYLHELCQALKLPGTIYRIDFPQDGRNLEGSLDFQYWRQGLIDLLQNLPNPIIVTHSFAGMFTLSTPELEAHLAGLVLMNTTTKNSFFEHVGTMQQKHQLPDLVPAATAYHLNPSNTAYKAFWKTYKHYCFTAQELKLGEEMINSLAFNNKAYHYAIENFYTTYDCQWIPSIPTLTLTSSEDYICPPDIFIEDPRFQQKNIINKVIDNAGHCPWLLHLQEVQACFDALIPALKSVNK